MSINSPMGIQPFSAANLYGQSPSAGSAPSTGSGSFINSPYFNSNAAMGGNGMGWPMQGKMGMGGGMGGGSGMPFWARMLGMNPSQFQSNQLQNPTALGPPLATQPNAAPGFAAQFPSQAAPGSIPAYSGGAATNGTPNFLPASPPPAAPVATPASVGSGPGVTANGAPNVYGLSQALLNAGYNPALPSYQGADPNAGKGN